MQEDGPGAREKGRGAGGRLSTPQPLGVTTEGEEGLQALGAPSRRHLGHLLEVSVVIRMMVVVNTATEIQIWNMRHPQSQRLWTYGCPEDLLSGLISLYCSQLSFAWRFPTDHALLGNWVLALFTSTASTSRTGIGILVWGQNLPTALLCRSGSLEHSHACPLRCCLCPTTV